MNMFDVQTVNPTLSNVSLVYLAKNTTQVGKEDTRWRYIAMAMFIFIGGVFIVTVNSLIIAAPRVYPPLRKKTYTFVSSLAVADVLTGILHTCISIMVVMRDFPWDGFHAGNAYCRMVLFMYVFPQCASIFNLVLLALDRYVAIGYPLKYDVILSSVRVKILLVLAWVAATLVASIGGIWTRDFPDGRLQCRMDDIQPVAWHAGGGLAFWVSIATMIFLYTRVYAFIRASTKMASKDSDTGLRINKRNIKKSQQRTTRMLLITMGVFAACWAPEVLLVHLLVDNRPYLMVYVYFTYIVSYLNSAMNFFIYAAACPKYRYAFRRLCSCCCARKLRDVSISDTS